MESHVEKLYEQFDQKRKAYEALNADKNDLEEIEAIENKLKKRNDIIPTISYLTKKSYGSKHFNINR